MPRYTGVVVFESLVPFHTTFSSRLASRFLRWKAHTCVFEGFARRTLVCVVVGGHSAQGRRESRFDVVEVVFLRRDAHVVCVDEAASVGVYGLVVSVDVEQHRCKYTSLW